jgi:hypothetical protein
VAWARRAAGGPVPYGGYVLSCIPSGHPRQGQSQGERECRASGILPHQIHAELIAAGYLISAEYEDRPVAGKKRPEVWVGYVFAEPEPPLPDLPKLDAPKAAEAKNVGELVREILDLLGDPHSTGFTSRR